MFNALIFLVFLCREQPPSGGCVLKHLTKLNPPPMQSAAAFGRLCVETIVKGQKNQELEAAAFGRLCVETLI